ncbi:MAG: ThiF family adenylyltransferase [Acidobacteriaceae bacterium]|nr:ThiF family adenylyltransferase [Acidobacteriaceae bacterium]
MTISRFSAAMTETTSSELVTSLLRCDGQEDICLAIYRPSTGRHRVTALVSEVLPPYRGERAVHGNATVTGDYVFRAAVAAAESGGGVALLHSHPLGSGWQGMSPADEEAESAYAYMVHRITGLPLLGMTLAGRDHAWSARHWQPEGTANWCENVRVTGSQLKLTWNDALRPPPPVQQSQRRTASGWGEKIQADLARLRVLVVGAGTVGLDVGPRLTATGIEHVGIMDFDLVEIINRDRMIGTVMLDVLLHRSKVSVAQRIMAGAATAANPHIAAYDQSICEPYGHAIALDYDLIFSCVDRPWPRAVLNQLAYSDLIPVIDGGLAIDPFTDGGMRNATWRSHVIRPGRPCLACNKQLELGLVGADRDGLLDDPAYIRGAHHDVLPPRQNVAALAVSVTAGLLSQFVSLIVAPGGRGDSGPLQYLFSIHYLDHLEYRSGANCVVENETAAGDRRITLTGTHLRARHVQEARHAAKRHLWIRVGQSADNGIYRVRRSLTKLLSTRSTAS